MDSLEEEVPQNREKINTLVSETRSSLLINYDTEFDAIQTQITKSQAWEDKALSILQMPDVNDQYEQFSSVKAYLKEILDDDDSGDLHLTLVSQEVYDNLRILLI